MGLPSGETEGGGGGERSGLSISSYYSVSQVSFYFRKERVKRENHEKVRKEREGLTHKRDVGS